MSNQSRVTATFQGRDYSSPAVQSEVLANAVARVKAEAAARMAECREVADFVNAVSADIEWVSKPLRPRRRARRLGVR